MMEVVASFLERLFLRDLPNFCNGETRQLLSKTLGGFEFQTGHSKSIVFRNQRICTDNGANIKGVTDRQESKHVRLGRSRNILTKQVSNEKSSLEHWTLRP